MFDIGSSLREARTRQGLDFEEMEARTKVRAKYLRFLEDERFEQLPGHTYTKGFLRVYADTLGLDGRLYVDEYNSRYVAGDEEHLRPPRTRTRDPRKDRRRSESRTVMIALAAILAVTMLVIAAWRFGDEDIPVVQGVNNRAQVQTSGVQPLKVVVRAVRGASYMEVRSGSPTGQVLYIGTLEKTQAQRFTKRSLYLAISSPKNVVVRVNGQRWPLAASGTLQIGGASSIR